MVARIPSGAAVAILRANSSALQLLSGRGDGLDQSVALGLFGVPGLAGKHELHGVAVTDLAYQPYGGATAGVQPQQGLVLGEDRVAGGHAHVSGQEQLVTDALGLALDGDDQGLGAARLQP
jgi:hypothetical protein